MDALDYWSRMLIIVSIPYFLIGMWVEWRYINKHRMQHPGIMGYEFKDSRTSIGMGLINLGVMGASLSFVLPISLWMYSHRLFELDTFSPWVWLMLFVAEDFAYYLYHRSAHRINLFWAEHVNHHTSPHYNLSTALRQSILGPVYTFIFWLPLSWLGFHPAAIAIMHTVSLLYQFWIHTEVLPEMKLVGLVFNTPKHHQLHHAKNGVYLDCNYGGILIIWDRLLGTFKREQAGVVPVYGTVKPMIAYNPLTVGLWGYKDLFSEIRHSRTASTALQWLIRPPEWSPQGDRWPADHPRAQTADSRPLPTGAGPDL